MYLHFNRDGYDCEKRFTGSFVLLIFVQNTTRLHFLVTFREFIYIKFLTTYNLCTSTYDTYYALPNNN